MKRSEWNFEYTAAKLADAATAKKTHHEERLTWWKDKQKEVVDDVKSKGLEVTESLATEYGTSALFGSTGATRGAQLTVKNEYQQKLNECHQKIRTHEERVKEYDAWLQMLGANPEQRVSLDVDDYIFFFGK